VHVVLQPRKYDPFKGQLALVGGYVRPKEDASTTAAATRVLWDKTGLTAGLLEQLMTFSSATRDPRGWSASVAYFALVSSAAVLAARTGLQLVPLAKAIGLAFDHDEIVLKATERCRRRSAYSSLPAFMLSPSFTLAALRRAYEAVLGRALNDSAFRRKVDELRVVEPVAGAASRSTSRPAQLYRLAATTIAEFDRTL
jgi:8-oxo-dGTP diphosphatase